MTQQYGNWTAETAVAISQRAVHNIQVANLSLEALTGFLSEFYGRLAAYGVNAEEVGRLRDRAGGLQEQTAALMLQAETLRDEVQAKMEGG